MKQVWKVFQKSFGHNLKIDVFDVLISKRQYSQVISGQKSAIWNFHFYKSYGQKSENFQLIFSEKLLCWKKFVSKAQNKNQIMKLHMILLRKSYSVFSKNAFFMVKKNSKVGRWSWKIVKNHVFDHLTEKNCFWCFFGLWVKVA
jgi:hypothetical protein